jgi:hypothetical protein
MKCKHLDNKTWRKIPTTKPIVYCRAKNREDCPFKRWEIGTNCWGGEGNDR